MKNLEEYVATCTREETLALLRFCLEAVHVEDVVPAIRDALSETDVAEIEAQLETE